MSKTNPSVPEMVRRYLGEYGFDGLYAEECGCLLDDLFPCNDGPESSCQAGYKIKCPGGEACPADGDCPWHIGPNKDT